MANITTTELVNKLFMFCEAYSTVKFFPYQAQFAKRIIRSLMENDGEEITALFSRQCIVEGSKVKLGNGEEKNIEDIREGDIVVGFDYDKFKVNKVIFAHNTGVKEVYELELHSGHKIQCTPNHRFLSSSSGLFQPLADFVNGEGIAYRRGEKLVFSPIKELKYIGEKRTYDIEVESSENYIANNILVHNSGKSETVATVSGGLAIVLPILANMPMFVSDSRLKMYKDGIMIGIFAPTLKQAQISFSRMKKRMSSDHAQAIMGDPEIYVDFDISNGENIRLSNGSLISSQSASEGSNIEGDSYMMIIVDEAQDVGNFKYQKSISPMGAFYNATKILIGTPTVRKGFFFESIERNNKLLKEGGPRNHFEYGYKTVIKYNPHYEKYVIGEMNRLGEHSDEFQMSYNLKWILERGMFISGKAFDKLLKEDMDTLDSDFSARHVVGIDLGKKQDSTVVTVLEVDWENPTVVEEATEVDADDFVAYNVYLKQWREFPGDDWNEQYYDILGFLKEFNIVRVVMDATGVGDVIYDRLKANLDYEVIPYVFSTPSKSDLYKHLNSEIKGGRVHIPGSEEVRETMEFKKFEMQMLDLEKTYRGQMMVVSHPSVAGAKDDYPDSLALAVWGAKGELMGKVEVADNTLYRDVQADVVTQVSNIITARRRR